MTAVIQLIEQVRNGTGSFPVWFSVGCSVAITLFCGWWRRLTGYLRCLKLLSILYVRVVIYIFQFMWIYKRFRGYFQTTSGIDGSFAVLVVSGLSHAAPEWRRAVSIFKFGLHLEPFTSESFSAFLCWTCFRPSGRLFRGGSPLAAFAPM